MTVGNGLRGHDQVGDFDRVGSRSRVIVSDPVLHQIDPIKSLTNLCFKSFKHLKRAGWVTGQNFRRNFNSGYTTYIYGDQIKQFLSFTVFEFFYVLSHVPLIFGMFVFW